MLNRIAEEGLSPRVRGNPIDGGMHGLLFRSIPACAGEPDRMAFLNFLCWVYPRVCGGTDGWVVFGFLTQGLSPRVRGNP